MPFCSALTNQRSSSIHVLTLQEFQHTSFFSCSFFKIWFSYHLGKTHVQMLLNLKNPELFIGFVCPIGVDLANLIGITEEILGELDYKCQRVKLSDTIIEIERYNEACSCEQTEERRLRKLMSAGDHLRETTKRGDAVMMCAINKIQLIRASITNDKSIPAPRTAYLIDSIKHPEEMALLKATYGKLFFCFSVSDTRENRVSALAKRLAKSDMNYDADSHRGIAETLIERDQKSDGKDFRQNVHDAFPLSDAFVATTSSRPVRDNVQRILETWFGHPFHTPTKDEYGMFLAKAAASRSADLSRQVGAAILTENGEVLSVGCNEVPHPQGRYVWDGDSFDKRDFKIGYDSTARMKTQIISEILKRFSENEWLNADLAGKPIKSLVEQLLTNDKEILRGTRVTSIIEFGRVVHAEMTAITECARRGISTNNSTLFCTTFPCHMCARHIIAAGIRRVVYIEPYPKSMARELYEGIISVNETIAEQNSVVFEAFQGLGPQRYSELYEMGSKDRKDSKGDAVKWNPKDPHPAIENFYGHFRDGEIAIGAFMGQENRHLVFGYDKTSDSTPFIYQED